ncbi:DNA methyltransferase [Gordonia phage CheeseTouch]
MKTGSLFSGYGGLDMAVNAYFGSDTAWFVEYDTAPSKILAHHWPEIPNHGDVTTIDWTTVEPVDILTGGYPCQPFSAAGRRQGTNDERHLWPYVREAIRHLRPRYTVLENVAGHRSLGFDRVLGDLAEDGMHVRWTSIRASDVGACHHRERLFILVTDPHGDAVREQPVTQSWRSSSTVVRRSRSDASDADSFRRGQSERQPCAGEPKESADFRSVPVFSDTPGGGRDGWPPESIRQPKARTPASRGGEDARRIEWGDYTPAVRRWERVTRPAPSPTEPNSNDRPRLNAAFAEWMMGLPDGHVTAVPGLSRAEQLKAIGNGVCPPQAYQALTILNSLTRIETAS